MCTVLLCALSRDMFTLCHHLSLANPKVKDIVQIFHIGMQSWGGIFFCFTQSEVENL